MSKKEYSIKEKREFKRNLLAVTIGAVAAGALLIAAISCASCVDNCSSKRKDDKSLSFENIKSEENKLMLELK